MPFITLNSVEAIDRLLRKKSPVCHDLWEKMLFAFLAERQELVAKNAIGVMFTDDIQSTGVQFYREVGAGGVFMVLEIDPVTNKALDLLGNWYLDFEAGAILEGDMLDPAKLH